MMFEGVINYIGVGVIFVIILVGWFIMTKKTRGKYSVNSVIFETRADNKLFPTLSKAGRFKTPEGKWEYRLKYPKFPFGSVKKMKPINFDHLISGAGQFLFAIRTSVDQIVPCIPVIETIKDDKGVITSALMKIKVMDEDLRPFVIDEIRRSLTRYLGKKSTWEKYQGVILIIVFALAVAIIMYSASGYLEAMSKIQVLR